MKFHSWYMFFFCWPVAGGFLIAPDALEAQDGLRASFDWSVPDRLGAKDADGKLHYRDTPEEVQAPAEGWEVDFTAAGSTGDIASWSWSIDGGAAIASGGPEFVHHFPEEGAYEVTLTVSDGAGGSASATRRVVVQDWLIVAVGDSYGSGEGNPDTAIPPEAIDDLQASLADLQAKQDALAAARKELTNVQADYDDTVAAARDVRSKLNAYTAAKSHEQDVCSALPPQPVQCADAKVATAKALSNLGVALGKLGLQGLIDSQGLIPQELARLEALAQASLDAARAGVTAAQDAVDAALAEVDVARGRAVPTWEDCPCHWSEYAGQAQAALQLEQADPRTSVTFVHLSCSGATILEGLIGAYAGIEPSCGSQHDDRPQVDQARDLVGGREIDALIIPSVATTRTSRRSWKPAWRRRPARSRPRRTPAWPRSALRSAAWPGPSRATAPTTSRPSRESAPPARRSPRTASKGAPPSPAPRSVPRVRTTTCAGRRAARAWRRSTASSRPTSRTGFRTWCLTASTWPVTPT